MTGNTGISGKTACVSFAVLIMASRMCCSSTSTSCAEKSPKKIKKEGEKSNGHFGEYLKLHLSLIDCNKA